MSSNTTNGPCAVACAENGPLLVRGDFELRGPGAEQAAGRPRIALCRCGRTANKPFCDGAHKDPPFSASGPVDASRALSDDADVAVGTVVVTPHADGPVHFDGVVEIGGVGGEGGRRFEGAWLCRCGHSANKPFCDGSHKEAGFEAAGE